MLTALSSPRKEEAPPGSTVEMARHVVVLSSYNSQEQEDIPTSRTVGGRDNPYGVISDEAFCGRFLHVTASFPLIERAKLVWVVCAVVTCLRALSARPFTSVCKATGAEHVLHGLRRAPKGCIGTKGGSSIVRGLRREAGCW